jgi:cytochrome o ubiquinol oxidase operon protein cyoD
MSAPDTEAEMARQQSKQRTTRSVLGSYITGFVLSVLLTIAAYTSVTNQSLGNLTLGIIVGLAVAQLLVQLIFFMHLGRGRSARLNLVVFGFMLVVIGIVVIGSLWIMHNLDYNMMPEDMNDYMIQNVNKGGI